MKNFTIKNNRFQVLGSLYAENSKDAVRSFLLLNNLNNISYLEVSSDTTNKTYGNLHIDSKLKLHVAKGDFSICNDGINLI